MKKAVCLCFLSVSAFVLHGQITITTWMPIFKGINRAAGTNPPALQVCNVLRIDLEDPDVQLLPYVKAANYVANSSETYSLSLSNFIKQQGVKVATAANFYNAVSGGSDPSSEGVACNVEGWMISTGVVVSAGDNRQRNATFLFTSNKIPTLIITNNMPIFDTNGVYTAVSGFYPLITNGIIIPQSTLQSQYPDATIHNSQPRTLFGLSQDRRYFYMMILDGRQSGYSSGATDTDCQLWLQTFGIWDAVNMDGGGSTAMYMQDCVGNPVPLGHSSYVTLRGRERYIGAGLGVFAKSLDSLFSNISADGGNTTATITWTTQSNATSQVEYGLTPAYGTLSPLDSALVTSHSVALGGLAPGARYYYRVRSQIGGTEYSSGCDFNSFFTTNVGVTLVFGLTNDWKYYTDSLDGVNWPSPVYDDTSWAGHGPGVLFAEERASAPNAAFIPNYATGTRMPLNPGTTFPYITYYFRTRFVMPNNVAGAMLTFSNYIDDGAIFYLNGVEIFRTNMPANSIFNSTLASASSCGGDAICPLVFSLSGSAISSLTPGTNLLAVEVHNFSAGSPDITFESALFVMLPPPPPPFITNVIVLAGETNATITWTTLSNSTSQVQFGITTALGNSTALDSALVTNHSVTVAGLLPATPYYFRAISMVGSNQNSADGTFTTTTFLVPLVGASNNWKYDTNAFSSLDWTAPGYNDSAWLGQGIGLLYIEDNVGVLPRNTALPGDSGGGPYPTYYFRTHFTLSNATAGFSLLFTNYIDDGAVFYLNGAEIQRVRMPAAPALVDYTTPANGCPENDCEATLDVPDVFRVGSDAMTNLLAGDNVLAAEVHQFNPNGGDIVFGSSVALVRALASETRLRIARTNNAVCVSWAGEFLTLQRASNLSGPNAWADVPGQIRSSPYCTTNPPSTTFYRLRN